MSLSLARCNDRNGSSRGAWFIRELPGFALVRCLPEHVVPDHKNPWCLRLYDRPDDCSEHSVALSAELAWGKDWRRSHALREVIGSKLGREFPTRSEALLIIEKNLARPAFSLLSEAVS